MISKHKFFLLLLILFRYPIDKDSQEFDKLDSYILNDTRFCPRCFLKNSEFCARLRSDYEFEEDIINAINALFSVRHTRVLREIQNKDNLTFAKYLAKKFDLNSLDKQEIERQDFNKLSENFLDEMRLEGMQFCPPSQVQRFVNFFAKNSSEFNVWLHMNVNIQPILLPYLHSKGFPVPKTYATCGFTTFQSADGVSLANLYSSDFKLKLEIAAQLIEGAITFSNGFEGFRIYITDLNKDNVVYDKVKKKVSFVDLDTVLIVDGGTNSKPVHRHDFLECHDCFAFSPTEICAHNKSDINIFAVCQFLREDLKNDRSQGFLSSVVPQFPELDKLLNQCVYCSEDCHNRFEVALRLIKVCKDVINIL